MPSGSRDRTLARMATVVLTGATSGIGRAARARLRDEGHEVVGVGRKEGADERADFGSLDAVRALADRLPERIDVLCHNAGSSPTATSARPTASS